MKQKAEGKFRKSVKHFFPNYMIIKLQVNQHAHSKSPFDFICHGTKHVAVEVKETAKDYFGFGRVTPHQWMQLKEWEEKGSDSYGYVLITLTEYDESFMIPIKEFIKVRDAWPTGRLHRLDMHIEFKQWLLPKWKRSLFDFSQTDLF